MFWNKEKEIKRILDRYGTVKGTALLTYFYSFVVESRKLFDYGRSSSELVPALTLSILQNHNQKFFAEYGNFFAENHSNKALIDELDRSKNKYYDETIFAEAPESDSEDDEEFYGAFSTRNDPVSFLGTKAKEIMRSHGLLNSNGTIPTVSGIYYPKPFSESVMRYCNSTYANMGDNKVKSEYIITSFYAAICATLLYKKKEIKNPKESYLFYQLFSFVDIKTVDVAAEHLLGTENGQPLAERIWSIISPYVSICLDVFDSVSPLSDDVILSGISNAFTLGMLVGDKYSSGEYKKVLDLFVKEDFYKLDNPNDLDDGIDFGAVCISGRLDSGAYGLRIHLNDDRAGDANIKVLPIDTVENRLMSEIAKSGGFIATDTGFIAKSTTIYGKLVNKGRWDSELQYAFTWCSSQHMSHLKSEL